MPLFDYLCEGGHRRELVRPFGTAVPCPDCGRPTRRLPAIGTSIMPTRGPTYRLGLVQEAAQELAYHHQRREEQAGHTLPQHNLFAVAMNEARRRGVAQLPPPPRKEGP